MTGPWNEKQPAAASRTRSCAAAVHGLRTDFAATVAHELNQPLAAIGLNGAAGLRWLAHDSPDLAEVRALTRQIIADVGRAGAILQRFCDAWNGQAPAMAEVSPNGILLDAALCLRPQIETHGARLVLALGDALPDVVADPVGLHEVVVNLAINGLQAMSEARSPSRILTLRSGCRGDRVVLAVEDEGPGIDPADMLRIFDGFYTTRPSGTGLGLAVSRAIVDACCGRMVAENGRTGGARFSIELQIAG